MKAITHLIIAEDENGVPVAFMGVELETLEMLFIVPEVQGKGVGKRLIRYDIEEYAVTAMRFFYSQAFFHIMHEFYICYLRNTQEILCH